MQGSIATAAWLLLAAAVKHMPVFFPARMTCPVGRPDALVVVLVEVLVVGLIVLVVILLDVVDVVDLVVDVLLVDVVVVVACEEVVVCEVVWAVVVPVGEEVVLLVVEDAEEAFDELCVDDVEVVPKGDMFSSH
jgi:hypothetical protein